jgi:hypothetical protein
MNNSTKPPEALLEAIARDLRPVQPSPRPFRLALRMAPLALMVSPALLLLIGIRSDQKVLGPLLTWGASIAQFGFAIVLVWVAAHESTPAGRLPRNVVYLVAITTSLFAVTLTWLTFSISPTRGDSGVSPWAMGLPCGISSTLAGGILVGLFSWVYRTSLAARPAVAGALYGAGAGVAINAGWRLACPISDPWHVLGFHGSAVVVITLLGALVGRIVGTRNRPLPDKRS